MTIRKYLRAVSSDKFFRRGYFAGCCAIGLGQGVLAEYLSGGNPFLALGIIATELTIDGAAFIAYGIYRNRRQPTEAQQ